MPTLTAYADAAPDLVSTVKNSTQLSNSIVDEQQDLDEFLVSSIGLADVGNDVVGGNRQALTDVLHLLVPTTDLLNRYHEALWCGIAGLEEPTHGTPLSLPGVVVSAVSRWALSDIAIQRTCRRYRQGRPLLQGTRPARRSTRGSGAVHCR